MTVPPAVARANVRDSSFASFRGGTSLVRGPALSNLGPNVAKQAGLMSGMQVSGYEGVKLPRQTYPTDSEPVPENFANVNFYSTKSQGLTGSLQFVTYKVMGMKRFDKSKYSRIDFQRGEPVFAKRSSEDDAHWDVLEMFNIAGLNSQLQDDASVLVTELKKEAITGSRPNARRNREGNLHVDLETLTTTPGKFAENYVFLWFVAGSDSGTPSPLAQDTSSTRLFTFAIMGRMEDITAYWADAIEINEPAGFGVLKTKITSSTKNIDFDSYQPLSVVPMVLKANAPYNMGSNHHVNQYLDETMDSPEDPLFIYRALHGLGPAQFSKNCISDPYMPPNAPNFDVGDFDPSPDGIPLNYNHAYDVDLGYRDVVFRRGTDQNGDSFIYPIYVFTSGKYIHCGKFMYSNGTKATIHEVNAAIREDNDIAYMKLRRLGLTEFVLNT